MVVSKEIFPPHVPQASVNSWSTSVHLVCLGQCRTEKKSKENMYFPGKYNATPERCLPLKTCLMNPSASVCLRVWGRGWRGVWVCLCGGGGGVGRWGVGVWRGRVGDGKVGSGGWVWVCVCVCAPPFLLLPFPPSTTIIPHLISLNASRNFK